MNLKRMWLIAVGILVVGCDHTPAGFGLEDSPIRYESKSFQDPNVLAEVMGHKYLKGQILDKSPVLKDLSNQENEARIAMAYLKIADRLQGEKAQGAVEVFLPDPHVKLEALLSRFDKRPYPGLTLAYHSSDDADVIAQYKDIKIGPDDLDANHVVLQSIEERRYREIASQLNSQLTRILISEKAAASKVSMQDFIQKQVFEGHEPEVSSAELSAYAAKIGLGKDEMTEELAPRFKDALKQQKAQKLMENYVAKNLLNGPIQVSFTEPQERLKLNDKWTPVMGYKDAPISLVAFSGADCDDCTKFITVVYDVMKKYDGYLKLNWIHNFKESDGIGRMMAKASICVDSVKPGKSLEFLNAFSSRSSKVDENDFYGWARKNNVNAEAMKKCFTDQANDPLLSQHLEYAKRIGVVANPTLLVEGQTLQGVVSPEQLNLIVLENIRAKHASWLTAQWRRIKSLVF